MKRYYFTIEIVVGMAAVSGLIYLMAPMLISGESTFIHDQIAWRYPLFQYFAEHIINGQFPYWNSFTHAGEPFYPIIVIAYFLDPLPYLTIFLGQFLTKDIVMLFNWYRFLQILFMTFGVYIVFRSLTGYIFVRLTLILILHYSSFVLASVRSDGVSGVFLFTPYIVFFLLRIIYYKDYRWGNWIIMAGLIGINWQSYRFSGVLTFLLFFLAGIFIFRRDLLKELVISKGAAIKSLISIVIIAGMMLPNLVIWLEGDNFVYPGRMLDVSKITDPLYGPEGHEGGTSSIVPVKMPYEVIYKTGTFSTILNFIYILSPGGIKRIGLEIWSTPTEGHIYLGLLPWLIIILGMIAGKHDLKKVWLLTIIGFWLLLLGPYAGLHWVLYHIYPPLWFIRHTLLLLLFFVFGLIYFYILGLNHIFSTWEGSLFPEIPSVKGFLGRFTKNEKFCRLSAVVIFSALIVGSVNMMIIYKSYSFYFLIIIFSLGWLFYNDLQKKYLFISLVISHVILATILNHNRLYFLIYCILVFGIPLILFLLIKTYIKSEGRLMYYAVTILFIIFTISLIGDLIYDFIKSSSVYTSQKHPALLYKADTTFHKPFLPQDRLITLGAPFFSSTNQPIRYPCLLYRQPLIFSPPDMPITANLVNMDKPFDEFINGSFESWSSTVEGKFLPEGFSYYQDGYGGSVERHTSSNGVKDGKYSVMLNPSSRGNSYIRYCTAQVEKIKDNYVVASVWAKSQNATLNAIKLYITDGTPSAGWSAYQNSGKWGRLIAAKYIDENAKEVCVDVNISYKATVGVYLDLLTINNNLDRFETILKSKRWDSLLMLKKYHELVYSDISPPAMEKMFAIGKSLFQFKKGAVLIEDNNATSLLRELGQERAFMLLNNYALINKWDEASLIGSRVSIMDFKKSSEILAALKDSDKKEEIFLYDIKNYNTNSFDMQVLTDKAGILYWADGYDKHWSAYVNDKKAPLLRANFNFKAVYLPAGKNNIKFVYDPLLFRISLYIFYSLFFISLTAPFIGFAADQVASFKKKHQR